MTIELSTNPDGYDPDADYAEAEENPDTHMQALLDWEEEGYPGL